MRYLLSSFIILIIILFRANEVCAQKLYPTLMCVETTSQGIVRFEFEPNEKHSSDLDHIFSAIDILLYKGVHSSVCGNILPLLTGHEQQEKFKLIERQFFSKKKGAYLNFFLITGSKTNKSIEVNRPALLSYLHEQNIITPLSNGF